MGTSGHSALTRRASSSPASGDQAPSFGNSMSEMRPRMSFSWDSKAAQASSNVLQRRILGRARMRRIFCDRFCPSATSRREWWSNSA